MQEYVHFPNFLQLFCRYSLFFSRARSTAWKGGTEKISALVSAPVSALCTTFGSQGWTALFDLVDSVVPKV